MCSLSDNCNLTQTIRIPVFSQDRAMDQGASRRHATAETRARSQVTSCDFCGGKLKLLVFGLPASLSLH
jgi:hypothetical protein